MKTTIDLPDDLVHKLKLRAVHDGRKLKDVVAEILRNGLAGPANAEGPSEPVILKDEKTGLPVIQCLRAPSRGEQLTPEEVSRILAGQESHWSEGHA